MEKKNRRGLPCPGRPKKIKGSGLVSGRSRRRRLPPAAFSAARFAPRPSRTLAAPSRGAKSSQRFRAAACLRRSFPAARFAPRSPQSLAAPFREQNSQRFRAAACLRRLFSAARFAPRLANPCGSVPGSKIFTAIPRRRLPPAAFSAARFAPRSPQSLAASSRGAKSSQQFRAAACFRRPFKLDSYNFFSETILTRGKKSL